MEKTYSGLPGDTMATDNVRQILTEDGALWSLLIKMLKTWPNRSPLTDVMIIQIFSPEKWRL
jgi:hypothetical protein